MAFCRWFNAHASGIQIALPTEQQWQHAAQGDEQRDYPWGDKFDATRCNSKEGGLRMTCPVSGHPNGASAYGVQDLVGNVWEWCDSMDYENRKTSKPDAKGEDKPRAVRGGSFISTQQRLKVAYHFYLAPHYRYPTLGFRVVTTLR